MQQNTLSFLGKKRANVPLSVNRQLQNSPRPLEHLHPGDKPGAPKRSGPQGRGQGYGAARPMVSRSATRTRFSGQCLRQAQAASSVPARCSPGARYWGAVRQLAQAGAVRQVEARQAKGAHGTSGGSCGAAYGSLGRRSEAEAPKGTRRRAAAVGAGGVAPFDGVAKRSAAQPPKGAAQPAPAVGVSGRSPDGSEAKRVEGYPRLLRFQLQGSAPSAPPGLRPGTAPTSRPQPIPTTEATRVLINSDGLRSLAAWLAAGRSEGFGLAKSEAACQTELRRPSAPKCAARQRRQGHITPPPGGYRCIPCISCIPVFTTD